MDLGGIAFYIVAVVTLAASIGVVTSRSVVYSALLLVAALMFTGLIYLILLADFLALVQILVYGGTVSVLLLFALMLTRPQEKPLLNHRGWPLAALAAVVLFAVLIYQSEATPWAPATPASSASSSRSTTTRSSPSLPTTSRTGTSTTNVAPGTPVRIGPADLGIALFTTWGVPFEIASLVLLVALMGSLVIARGSPTPTDDTDVPEAPMALETTAEVG
jgi:NADH-quinone oxidoreductase subunit J